MKPNRICVGEAVEAQLSFSVIPLRGRKHKMV